MGLLKSRDVLFGTVAAFWRKLAGTSNYDGLPELIARTYRAVGISRITTDNLARNR